MMSTLRSHSRHRLLSVAAVFLISAVPAAAACKVRAIFVQPPADVPEKAVLVVGQKLLEIELPSRNLSPELELPARGNRPGETGTIRDRQTAALRFRRISGRNRLCMARR